MVYFLFISLSTLRLTASLSIFTGLVAASSSPALGLYYLPPAGAETFFTSRLADRHEGRLHGRRRRRLRVRRHPDPPAARRLRSIRSSEKNRVVGMFGQYVSPAVVDQLLSQPIDHEGRDPPRDVMFLDIRDFTAFAEQRTPRGGRRLPEHAVRLDDRRSSTRNHGIINKFLGDGFMAVFGAPLSDGRDAARTRSRAALDDHRGASSA